MTSPIPSAGPERLGVLVVDDNTDAADSLALVLEVQGFEVQTAYTGQDALAIAERQKPGVALLDIGLPDIDGYRVARRLRESSWAAKTFMVAVTGYGTTEDKHRAYENGFDLHITKPISPEKMRQLIEFLEDRRLRG